jgi:hypothetical protein
MPSYQRVEQVHDTGCFVAAVAMLLGRSYEEALKLIHPHKSMDDYDVGMHSFVLSEAGLAQEYLRKLGIKVTPSRERYLRRLRRDAILIIRWACEPTRLHAIIYIANEQRFLDSAYSRPLKLETYQKQLDAVMLIDSITPPPRVELPPRPQPKVPAYTYDCWGSY